MKVSQTNKITHLQFHLLEIGTLTKASLSLEYFDCLSALTEIEIEAEQNDPPICINFSLFLDESICFKLFHLSIDHPNLTIVTIISQYDMDSKFLNLVKGWPKKLLKINN